ncbi:MAG: flagellar hook-length control protein FliK [Tabrizicola sp.]|nr:flagellar hook-length control protein FliK [Tabrizicola sp.]
MASARATTEVTVPEGVGHARMTPAAGSAAASDPVAGKALKVSGEKVTGEAVLPMMTRPASGPAGTQAAVTSESPETAPQPPAPGFWERFFTGTAVLADAADRSVVVTLVAPGWQGSADEALSISVEVPPSTRSLPDEAALGALPQQVRPTEPMTTVAPPVAAASDLAVLTALPEQFAEVPEDGVIGAPGPLPPGATPASGPTGPATLPPVAQVAQVAPQIVAALSQGKSGVTELALAPEELGHVRLSLEPDAANPDRMVVMISFERPETLDLFRRHAVDLAEALRAAGYSGADIGFGQHAGGEGSDRSNACPESAQTAVADFTPPPPPPGRSPGAGSLDLRL